MTKPSLALNSKVSRSHQLSTLRTQTTISYLLLKTMISSPFMDRSMARFVVLSSYVDTTTGNKNANVYLIM